MIKTEIKDGRGNGSSVKVSRWGQLSVGELEFSQAYTVEANVINTAFTFAPPVTNSQFIITGILLYANKGVGVNDATIDIYESETADGTTPSKLVLETEMVKQTNRDLTGLNIIVTGGKWLNIKTDDATIFATVLGYYVPIPRELIEE